MFFLLFFFCYNSVLTASFKATCKGKCSVDAYLILHVSSIQTQELSGCNWVANYTIAYRGDGVMFEPVASVSNQTREYVMTLPAFGKYTLRLSVTNNKGLSTHTLKEVEVYPPEGEWDTHIYVISY